jgi:hypothetical protein
MAVIASASATFLHEGVGHGLTAWVRGDIPTELTSNHLSSLRSDHWVEAAGTLVNLLAGTIALLASRGSRDRVHRRYFLWLLAALNLLPGAGYFLFSGILGVGDWQAVISDSQHPAALRTVMIAGGALLYLGVVRWLAVAVRPFVSERKTYNRVGRWPYVVAGLFSCLAGLLDPLGAPLLFQSTIPAAFGGSSGLLWADSLVPREPSKLHLVVRRAPLWWVAALIVGLAYIGILGPGIRFTNGGGGP